MRSIQREPLTMGKQQVNFITCDCESSAPFFIHKSGREPTSCFFLSTITNRTKIIADISDTSNINWSSTSEEINSHRWRSKLIGYNRNT